MSIAATTMSPNGAAALTSKGEILRVEGLSKTFPGTKALHEVDFDIRAGEVHALVGHNGSGKSTLIKVLSGYHQADPGARAFLDGEPVEIGDLAHDIGETHLSFVHQDLGLILELNAIDNLALHGGFRRTAWGSISWRHQRRLARQLVAPFHHDFDVEVPLSKVTPVERTIVAIAAALQGWNRPHGVLVLDEPTAVLPPSEVGRLFDIVRGLRKDGAGILYVSHRLDEIFDLADRVTVLRNGQKVATRGVAGIDKQALVRLMLGDEVEADYRNEAGLADDAATVLEVRNLSGNYVRDVGFSLCRGEVLGIAGLPADGRDELPRLLIDGRRRAGGEARGPQDWPEWRSLRRIPDGAVVLLPADRAREGIIGPMTVAENVSLSVLGRFRSAGRLDPGEERSFVGRWIDALQVKAGSPDDSITTLSGGNQQKVLFARVLGREPEVLVMSEPTAGVDIGARHAIYDLVAEQAEDGLGVVVTSSDVDDLLAMCHRVLVLRHGVVVEELAGESLNEFELVHAMEGGTNEGDE
jgi:ABC-type sugar transport system ATPase subunit